MSSRSWFDKGGKGGKAGIQLHCHDTALKANRTVASADTTKGSSSRSCNNNNNNNKNKQTKILKIGRR